MHLVYVYHLPRPCTLVQRATACVGVGVGNTCGAVLEIMDDVILPVEVKEDLIQRLKRPPLSRNRFRYVNTQLPQMAIPSDMANKAICEGCFRSNAVLLRCAEADCHMHFHPLCAEITNRARVITAVDQGDVIEFKCAIHSQGEQHSVAQYCAICGIGNKWSDMIGCEGCARWYHLFCLVPQLTKVPNGDWFCSDCHEIGKRMLSEREVVEAGD